MKQEHKFQEGEIVRHKLTKDKMLFLGYANSTVYGMICLCRDDVLSEVDFYESELEKINNKLFVNK